MPVAFAGISSAVAVDSTTLAVDVPTAAQVGDLLLFAFVVGNDSANDATNFFTALTLPSGWVHAGYSTTTTNRIIFAYHYVAANDPGVYTFTYVSAANWQGVLIDYTGTARSFAPFTPVNTPPNETLPSSSSYETNGFFAPVGSVGAALQGTASNLPVVSSTYPTTEDDQVLVLYILAQFNNAGTATSELDDPVPMVNIRLRSTVSGSALDCASSLIVVDQTYPSATAPPPSFTVNSSVNESYVVMSLAVESFDTSITSVLDEYDTYKAKVMRGMLPPPFDKSQGSNISRILMIIGYDDNDIGGLFGDADFLPDD